MTKTINFRESHSASPATFSRHSLSINIIIDFFFSSIVFGYLFVDVLDFIILVGAEIIVLQEVLQQSFHETLVDGVLLTDPPACCQFEVGLHLGSLPLQGGDVGTDCWGRIFKRKK